MYQKLILLAIVSISCSVPAYNQPPPIAPVVMSWRRQRAETYIGTTTG